MSEFKENRSNINLTIDIKSSYNLVEIFSFLNKKKRLNVIIYNNQIQKILGVNLQNYKETSGKYKIGEKNGKGKEYTQNTNILVFDGEYINGKKNGKGKEYYNNRQLKFEGEYLNGLRRGEGKEY